jgi:hypothetical protein
MNAEQWQQELEERAWHEWRELIAQDPGYEEWIESLRFQTEHEHTNRTDTDA